MTEKRTIFFLILPHVHLMDLAGPAQVFYEASNLGTSRFDLVYGAGSKQVVSEQGLLFSSLVMFDSVQLKPNDFIFIPGIDFRSFSEGKLDRDIRMVTPWLQKQCANGVQIASVCSGALVLAAAGLLRQRKCTSHWKCIDYIRQHYPDIHVLTDRLYVKDLNVYTSAGMTSGIDMALSMLEKLYGPILPARVAREMVVYLRRNNTDTQQTIYLDYRTHYNPSIHLVQDFIVSHPSKNPGLDELAAVGNTSVRTLTRVFKMATGHTINEFKNAVKVELARTIIHNSAYTMEKISALCGFQSVRHFRRIWMKQVGVPLASFRKLKNN